MILPGISDPLDLFVRSYHGQGSTKQRGGIPVERSGVFLPVLRSRSLRQLQRLWNSTFRSEILHKQGQRFRFAFSSALPDNAHMIINQFF